MQPGGIQESHSTRQGDFGLPEDRSDEFDERVLEDAIRNHRNNEFAALAQLNS